MNRPITVAATKESQAIRDAIYRYGCVTLDQLAYFMPPSPRKKENYHAVICNHLVSAKIAARTENNVLFPFINQGYSQAMIDSLWVMIDLLNDGDDAVPFYEKAEASFKAEHPETLCFIKNCADTVKVLSVETASQLSLITFIQDKYNSSSFARKDDENKRKCITIITIRDKALLPQIAKLGITIPHKIAYLEGSPTEKPVITYYGNSPRK